MPGFDFNGDGRDDVFWRNTTNGYVTNWLGQPDGGFVSNDQNALDPWAAGAFEGFGDFNGDGRTDTLMRGSNGDLDVSLTYPEGAHYFHWSTGFVRNVPTSWSIAGTGDFNGDGRDDILWRRSDGALTNWLSLPSKDWSFPNFVSNDTAALSLVPTSWHVAGTGDFNGDGRSDILWRRDDGAFTNWLGQPNGGFVSNDAHAWAVIPTNWQVVGTGDFNGDGKDDILWRRNDGAFTAWLAKDGGGFVSNDANAWAMISTDWHVVGTGDYNGDGKDDVLWRRDDGALTNWLAGPNGSFVSNDAHAFNHVPNFWVIQPNTSGLGLWDY